MTTLLAEGQYEEFALGFGLLRAPVGIGVARVSCRAVTSGNNIGYIGLVVQTTAATFPLIPVGAESLSTTSTLLAYTENLLVDTSGSSFTTLAATQIWNGKRIRVRDTTGSFGTNAWTLNGNGVNVEDPASRGTFAATVTLNTANMSAEWMFDHANNQYVVMYP